jgi:hypothetical protein
MSPQSYEVLMPSGPLLLASPSDATIAWIAAAADDPGRRLARALPEELDFRHWAGMLRSMQSAALPDTQLGAPLLFGAGGLELAEELAWRSRYPAVVDGKRFIGTAHVHAKGGATGFDAGDLALFLRSDYPGFLDLLVTAEGASAIVRTRRFLYISGDRVDRDPFLLSELHEGFRSPVKDAPADVQKAVAEARSAVRTVCHLYELALYRGAIEGALRLDFRPG